MPNSKPKPIIVNIKGDYPETRKVRPTFTSEGRTILVMEKTTETTVGWSIDVTDAISHDIKGKKLIDVIRGDRLPLKYGSIESKDPTVRKSMFPHMSIDDLKKFADVEVFKKAVSGLREQLGKLTPLMWIVLILSIIAVLVGCINIYMLNGVANAVAKIPLPTPGPPSV